MIPERARYWLIAALLWAAAGLCAGRSSYREDPDYLIDTWEADDGMPENSATGIVQGPDNYLWIGTFGGLARFDGEAFRTFDPDNSPGMPMPQIVNMFQDSRGRLWISTYRDVAVREGKTWRKVAPPGGWKGFPVRCFTGRAGGDVLLTTFNGRIFEYAGDQLKELPVPGEAGQGCLCFTDSAGQWWIVQNMFIGRWTGTQWERMIDAPPVFRSEVGGCLAPDGSVWIVLRKDLVRLRDGREVGRVKAPGLGGSIWSMMCDSAGNIWITTGEAGLFRISPDGQERHWKTENGLASTGIRAVFEDAEHNIWVGTSGGGLQRFRPRRFQSFSSAQGLPERNVTSVARANDGGVWCATYGKGVYHLKDGKLDRIELPREASLHIQSVLEDRTGRLWIGTFESGLWIREAGAFRRIPDAETGGDNVIALFEDSRGHVWVSGGGYCAEYDGQAFRVYKEGDGVKLGGVTSFAEDPGGSIWIASARQVLRKLPGAPRFEEVTGSGGKPVAGVGGITRDSSGALWFLGLEGIQRWRDNSFSAVSGLPRTAAMVEDKEGTFWISAERQAMRVEAADLHAAADGKLRSPPFHTLDMGDGLPGLAFSSDRQPLAVCDAAGRVWFAMQKGLAGTDPGLFVPNDRPPPVRVEALKYAGPDGKSVSIDLDDPEQPPVVLPAGSRNIEIHFAALSYTAPEKVRYRVRLEGSDTEWHDAADRINTYTDLPPREFTFRVKAGNNDGVWNETGASLTFAITPYWWQRTSFQIAGAVALVACGALIAMWLAGMRHQRIEALLALEQQRTELAHLSRVAMLSGLSNSLAHELNQPLAIILSNAQAAQRLMMREPPDITEVREILSDIISEDRRAGDVIQRLRAMLKPGETTFLPLELNEVTGDTLALLRSDLIGRGVTVESAFAGDLPPVRADRVQIQQVMINLITNACDAMAGIPPEERRLVISTAGVGGEVRLSVSDCGTGLPPGNPEQVFKAFFTTKTHGMGMGLAICRTIAEAHQGKLWAERNTGAGATFHLTLPADSSA